MKDNIKKPPKIAEWLLSRTLGKHDRDIVLGDFEEFYIEFFNESGAISASTWYWMQMFKSVPSFISNSIYWNAVMFKNYFKITVRNLLKNKVFSLINISGLAVGMACCIVIFLFVQDELSWDRFHENADQIYRVNREWKYSRTGEILRSTLAEYTLAQNLVEEFPEVINTVRICRYIERKVSHGENQFDERIYFADPSILTVFSFPLIKGDRNTALNEPNSIVITEDFARKYFGSEDPVGKILTIRGEGDYTITGIISFPRNSHFRFNHVASYRSVEKEAPKSIWFEFVTTYILLRKDASPETLEVKIHDFTVKHYGEEFASTNRFYLETLASIHLNTEVEASFGESSDIKYSYAYSTIAFIILLVACINYMNLSTARASRRAKEVGIRKVVGAKRTQLIMQFIGESIIIAFISLLIAIVLASLFLPYFNDYTGKPLSIFQGNNQFLLMSLFILTIIVGFFAGSYPALFTSAFHPADVIKQTLSHGARGSFIRKGLVVFQFAISLVFIIGTIIVLNQVNFIKSKDLGFYTENVVTLPIIPLVRAPYETIEKEFLAHPNITNMISSFPFMGGETAEPQQDFVPEGFSNAEAMKMSILKINYDFFDFYGIELVEGRLFSPENPSDLEKALILNETAVKQIGWDSPIGKRIKNERIKLDGTVIGVVKDFHNFSLYEKIHPTVFQYHTKTYFLLSLKIRSTDIPGTIAFLEEKWNEYSLMPNFRYSFLDDDIAAFYLEEEITSNIFKFASLLSVFLACLGLFGLASFSAERRVKEIGIRRVLGATVPGIVFLLSKDFAKLVLLANVIAWPIAYLIMNRWLQNFAYKDNIGWWVFILAGILTLAIALITISYQSIKAATANPIDSLRFE